jgi:hypothetical protein
MSLDRIDRVGYGRLYYSTVDRSWNVLSELVSRIP